MQSMQPTNPNPPTKKRKRKHREPALAPAEAFPTVNSYHPEDECIQKVCPFLDNKAYRYRYMTVPSKPICYKYDAQPTHRSPFTRATMILRTKNHARGLKRSERTSADGQCSSPRPNWASWYRRWLKLFRSRSRSRNRDLQTNSVQYLAYLSIFVAFLLFLCVVSLRAT